VPLGYLINVYKSFYLVYFLIPIRLLCFADRITEVIGRGISPGEPVFLNGYLIVGVPLGIAYTLSKSPLSRTLIY
jgi:hypothetical protein